MIIKIIKNQDLKIFSNTSFLSNNKGIAGSSIKNFKKNNERISPSQPNDGLTKKLTRVSKRVAC